MKSRDLLSYTRNLQSSSRELVVNYFQDTDKTLNVPGILTGSLNYLLLYSATPGYWQI